MEHPDWALPARHRIGQIELQDAVHVGSAGVLYRGWDHGLAQSVAIEEYLPHGLARRLGNGHVDALDDGSRGAFELGRQAFSDKARTLARCEHPSLLRVLHLLQGNGTAYSVMPWYSGRPMVDVVGPEQPLLEEDLRSLLADLLGALHAYHRHGGLHGDLRPAKVLLLDDGHGLLLGPDGPAGTLAGRPWAEPADAAGPAPLGPQADLQAMALLAQWCMGCASPAERMGVATGGRRTRRGVEAQYSPAFRRWLECPFASDPNERPLSAAQFRHWLLQLPDRLPAPAVAAALEPASAARGPAQAVAQASGNHATQALAEPGPALAVATPQEPPPLLKAAAALPAELPPRAPASRSPVAATPALPSFDALDALDAPARPVLHRSRPLQAAVVATVLVAACAAAWGWWEHGRATAPQRNALAIATAMAPTGQAPGLQAQAAPAVQPAAHPAAHPAAQDASAVLPPAVAASAPAPAPEAAASAVAAGSPLPAASAGPAASAPRSTAPAPVPAADGADTAPAVDASLASRAQTQQRQRTTIDAPRAQCGDRTEFSLYRCMQQQCAKPRWQSHADCVRFRQADGVS
jgi:non-specific serine/threonine protein kinase